MLCFHAETKKRNITTKSDNEINHLHLNTELRQSN